ncbi:MAG: hypothetical protein KAS04_04965 [Candidatus Aenigmarchaeota archaeon]|nr:hypothetical protein [Candidatus Aenigmarchaeota archaeon]
MVKLRKIGDSFMLTVPSEKVKKKGWKGGEEFDVNFDHDGNIVFSEI